MVQVYASKKAALRFVERAYGENWAERARYLEVQLPDNEMLYAIQSRAASRGNDGSQARGAQMRAAANSGSFKGAKQGSVRFLKAVESVESIVKKVWVICDLLNAQADKKAARSGTGEVGVARKEILAECERQGINRGTAATQYQKWRKSHQTQDSHAA